MENYNKIEELQKAIDETTKKLVKEVIHYTANRARFTDDAVVDIIKHSCKLIYKEDM